MLADLTIAVDRWIDLDSDDRTATGEVDFRSGLDDALDRMSARMQREGRPPLPRGIARPETGVRSGLTLREIDRTDDSVSLTWAAHNEAAWSDLLSVARRGLDKTTLDKVRDVIARAEEIIADRERDDTAGDGSPWSDVLAKALDEEEISSSSGWSAGLPSTTESVSERTSSSHDTQDTEGEGESVFGVLADRDALQKEYERIEGSPAPKKRSRNTDRAANPGGSGPEDAPSPSPSDADNRQALADYGFGGFADAVADNGDN